MQKCIASVTPACMSRDFKSNNLSAALIFKSHHFLHVTGLKHFNIEEEHLQNWNITF